MFCQFMLIRNNKTNKQRPVPLKISRSEHDENFDPNAIRRFASRVSQQEWHRRKHFQRMKYAIHCFLIMLVCAMCTGCQTAPKARPLTELSDAELIEIAKYGPAEKPKGKEYDWTNALKTVALVIIFLPVAAVYSLAESGSQISAGK